MVLVRLNIILEKRLRKAFKKHALDNDVSMSELIVNFIKEEVGEDGQTDSQ